MRVVSVLVIVFNVSVIGCIFISETVLWSINTEANTSAHLSWYNSSFEANSGWVCFIFGVILIFANAIGNLCCEIQYTAWLFIGVSFLVTPSDVGILNVEIPLDTTGSLIHLSRLLRIWSLSMKPIPFNTELIAV